MPLAMLVVYGLRDIPPTSGCGDEDTPREVIDAYRSGVWWFVAAGEALAVALLVLALRRRPEGKGVEVTIALAACAAGGGASAALLADESVRGLYPGLVLGFVATLPVWAALRALAGRRPTLRGAVLPVALLIPLAIVLYVVLLFAAYGPGLALAVLLSAATIAAAAAFRAGWAALAATAAFYAIVIVPAAAAMVAGRGHGPLFC